MDSAVSLEDASADWIKYKNDFSVKKIHENNSFLLSSFSWFTGTAVCCINAVPRPEIPVARRKSD